MDGREQKLNSLLDDAFRLSRKQQYRIAADYIAAEFAKLPSVRRVALFGSVNSDENRYVLGRKGRRRLHDPKDLDLAVWMEDLHELNQLRIARSRAVNQLFAETEIGVAHHQVDVFILNPKGDHLGRLCCFNRCPKGKPECNVKDCGKVPFLWQREDFRLDADALKPHRIRILYERETPQ